MALTLARTANNPNTVPRNGGAIRFIPLQITFDSSYPTGGEAVTAAQLGLRGIYYVVPSVDTTGTYILTYNHTAGTTGGKFFVIVSATGAEVANEVDLAAIIFNVLVLGY